MADAERRKCKCCHKLFRPDPRNRHHQRYCAAPSCRAASKAASQARWLAAPENQDYFRGPVNVARVKAWRARNPGYWRKRRRVRGALRSLAERGAGANPAAVAKRHIARINHVHCKDVRPAALSTVRKADRSFLDSVVEGVFTVPGDGAIDFSAVLEVLKDARYQGWLVVEAEQDLAKAHPLTYARMGYDYLSGAVRRIGL